MILISDSRTRNERRDSRLMLLVACAALMCLVLNAGKVFGAPVLDLGFKDSVWVNDTVILLQDLCEIRGTAEPRLREQIGRTVIGESAPAGFSRFVASDDVIRLVERTCGANVVLRREKRIHVTTKGVRHQVSEFQDEIRDFIVRGLDLPAENVTIAIADTTAGFLCLDKPFYSEVKESATRVAAGNNTLKLEIRQGSVIRTVMVMCRVSVLADVVETTEDIVRGTPLTTANCMLVRKTLENYNLQPCTSLKSVLGQKSRQTLRRGTMVCAQYLEKIPLITKGQPVALVASQGRLRILVNCLARESGSMGEKIWVENTSSKKLILAVITGAGKVATLAQAQGASL